MSRSPGELVGSKYRIVRVIGEGGMGAVYEARHELLGAPVALKFLHRELAERPGLAARFLQEARVSATVQSPHVARVTDVDTSQDGEPYLVMELLSGESLQKLLDRQRVLNPDQAIDFTLQILAGLEAAHARGIVHRDLKPDNVFITPTGAGPLLKLIDFGIAKLRDTSEFKKGLTRAGVLMGTAEYMAPEQLYAANEVDHRADLYSLGVMLFEMLSGVRPADGDSAEAIIANVLSGRVRRLSEVAPALKPGLANVVERALSVDRNLRQASAAELRAELSRFAGELSYAGHLAARATPMAELSGAPALGHAPTAMGGPSGNPQVSATVVAPAVAKTLPPDEAAPARGRTQAAPIHPGFSPPLLHHQAPPRVSRRRSRARPWLIALGTVVVLGGAGIGVASIVIKRGRSTEATPTLPPVVAPPISSVTTIEPIVIPTSPEPATQPALDPKQPKNPTSNTARPKPAETTPEVTPPGKQPLPFPSFALPSSLPPLPSTFPQLPASLPSFFPQIPGLTVPRPPPQGNAGTPGQ